MDGKSIYFFIPDMTFLVSISDIRNNWEEGALAIFRNIEYEGDPQLALIVLKALDEYFIEIHDRECGISDKEILFHQF